MCVHVNAYLSWLSGWLGAQLAQDVPSCHTAVEPTWSPPVQITASPTATDYNELKNRRRKVSHYFSVTAFLLDCFFSNFLAIIYVPLTLLTPTPLRPFPVLRSLARPKTRVSIYAMRSWKGCFLRQSVNEKNIYLPTCLDLFFKRNNAIRHCSSH